MFTGLIEAMGEEPRLKASWEVEWQKFDKFCREQGGPWEDFQIQMIGSYLIFGARTIDDFPTKILRLFERYGRIKEHSHGFLIELEQMLGLNK